MIHTIKGFGIVKKAEIDVFLELSCYFDDPVDVGNLISGSSAFSKTSLNIWKLTVHRLLKPGLENFEHYFTSVWNECNCAVVWTIFGISFLWDCNENWLFPVLYTLFQKNKRRFYTWTLPDGQHWNQIDYILWSQRWRSSTQSAKTRLVADCGSDHELLIAKFRLKLKKAGKTTRPFRYDLNQIPYDYTLEVRNRFKGLYLIDRVPDDLWTEVPDIVRESGIKTIHMENKCKKAKEKEQTKAKEKTKDIPIWRQSSK